MRRKPKTGIEVLFSNNKKWAKERVRENPDYFRKLARIQKPGYLWIGCSDSRVPANEIVGLKPGELFVHRNVANVVVHTDLNCLSVLEFAINVLKVRHVIVCGHYGCSGVRAALANESHGVADNWLRHIRDVMKDHRPDLRRRKSPEAKLRRLCELNVQAQVLNVCAATMVRAAWKKGQALTVHGLIYDIHDGLLDDSGLHFSSLRDILRHPASREGK